MSRGNDIAKRLLKSRHEAAEHANAIWVRGGASDVGLLAHDIGIPLANNSNGRMCCVVAIGAGSAAHIEIAKKAKGNVVINGCENRCASRVLKKAGARVSREIIVSNYIEKQPPLDITEGEVREIAKKEILFEPDVKGLKS